MKHLVIILSALLLSANYGVRKEKLNKTGEFSLYKKIKKI